MQYVQRLGDSLQTYNEDDEGEDDEDDVDEEDYEDDENDEDREIVGKGLMLMKSCLQIIGPVCRWMQWFWE